MSNETSTPGSRKALGKGLGALLGPKPAPSASDQVIRGIAVDHIQPNPYQPRRSFHPDRLNELAASIQQHGMVQPILVRAAATPGRFEIIAGERRWRAARVAGLAAIPAIVQSVPDDKLLEMALVENIQREDLNPIETAMAFEQLLREFRLTHDQVAQRTGKDRTTITNILRLLKLAPEVQKLVADGQVSMGHARALVTLDHEDQKALAAKIIAQGLSVRTLERIIQKSKEPSPPAIPEPLDPNLRAAIQEMERSLGTRVRVIEGTDGRGRVEIDYYTPDDLERIYNHIVRT